MNSRHDSINFTVEHGDNNTLPFLDCKVTRIDNAFTTSVFRKDSFSGVYTHFNSFLPSNYKDNILFVLIHRCFTLCSSFSNFHLEMEKLKTIFKKNGFPPSLINRCIKRYLNKIINTKRTVKPIKEKILLVLPFLDSSSIHLKKKLERSFKEFLPSFTFHVIFSSTCRIKSFLKYKDANPSHLRSHCIYKLQCSSFTATYIGESVRHYDVRVCEHSRISEFTGKFMNSKAKTAVYVHMEECAHHNPPENFSTLANNRSANEYSLQVQESILIARDNPSLNKAIRSVPLLLF